MNRKIWSLIFLSAAICAYGYNPDMSTIHRVGNYIYEVEISNEKETGYATLIDVKPGYEPKGEITIPGSVTIDGVRYVVNHIGYTYYTDSFYLVDRAFKDFPEITKVNIPSTITDIGTWEFIGCTGINEFHVNAANKNFKDVDGVLYYRWGEDYSWHLFRMPPARPKTRYTVPEDVLSFEACAFADQKTLRQIVLSPQCHFKDDLWMWGNRSIREIDASNSGYYENRDGMVFYTWGNDYDLVACPPGLKLDRYVVPQKCKVVRGGAFCYSSIPEVVLHDNLEVDGYAFVGSDIKTLECTAEAFRKGLRDLCVGCKSLTKVHIKGNGGKPVVFGQHSFSMCESLSEVKVDAEEIQIQTAAFYGCSSLKEFPFEKVTLMDGSDIHSYWSGREFEKSGLKSVEIPWTIETIPADCFSGCSDLTEVHINMDGDAYTKFIGGSAFENCSSLETIRLGGIQYVGGAAFRDTPLKKIIIPERSDDEGIIRIGLSFHFLEDTRVYLSTTAISYVSADASGNMTTASFIVSFLDKDTHAVPNFWKHMYCPAGMAEWYETAFHADWGRGGPVTEMFSLSLSDSEPSLTILPNPELKSMTFEVTEVEINGEKASKEAAGVWRARGVTPAKAVETRISYLVDGVPMTTVYPAYFTSLEKEVLAAEASVLGVYDLSGIRVADSQENLRPGVYILRMSDGTSRKIIIRN